MKVNIPIRSNCKWCNKALVGRRDKEYCDITCKNEYHYANKQTLTPVTKRIDQFLHRNRTILYEFSKDKSKNKFYMSKAQLLKRGFKFEYFTGTTQNKEGKTYFSIYDFSYIPFSTEQVMVVRK